MRDEYLSVWVGGFDYFGIATAFSWMDLVFFLEGGVGYISGGGMPWDSEDPLLNHYYYYYYVW